MTYYGSRSGFTEAGMGAAFAVSTTPNEELRSVQQDLQRMGLLAAGTGATGADGRMGFRTLGALNQAKARLGRTTPAYSLSNAGRLVTIPDDFLAAIHAAAAPGAVLTATLPPSPTMDASTVEPSTAPLPPLVPPLVEPAMSRTTMYLIGGSVAAVGTLAAVYFLWPKITSNRRRRFRRNRRRRHSRR